MILLDHNIPENQVELLRARRIRPRQIGFEVGRPEWDDHQEILRYLHQRKQITFITRDLDFYNPRLCHPKYCLVFIACPVLETAKLALQFLGHVKFNSHAKRMGKVVRLSTEQIMWREVNRPAQQTIPW